MRIKLQTLKKTISRISDTQLSLLVLVVASIIVPFRRLDAFTNPQFFAEDGRYWYADAYNLDLLTPLITPVSGYFQTISRLTGTISLLFPVEIAPLIFSVVSLVVHLLPVFFLLSERFSKISIWLRIIFVLQYVLIPNTAETYLNLTNAQWYLAILAFSILISQDTKRIAWKVFDYSFLILSGLSGPFSILLLPVVVLQMLNNKKINKLHAIVITTATIQVASILLTGGSGRMGLHDGFGIIPLYQIYSKQIFMGVTVGPIGYEWINEKVPFAGILTNLLSFTSILVVIYGFIKSKTQIRYATTFAITIFIFSLLFPTVHNTTTYETMLNAYHIRYWLIPMLLISITFTSLANDKNKIIKIVCMMFVALQFFFFLKNYRHIHNFQYTPYVDYAYENQVKKFELIDAGEKEVFPINPPGWKMTLIKKD